MVSESLRPKITIFTHSVKVENVTPSMRKVLYWMASDYTQFGFVKDPIERKTKWAPIKTFMIYGDSGDTFYMHRNQFNDFKQRLIREEVRDIEVIYAPLPEPDKVDLKVREGWILNEDQVKASDFMLQELAEPGGSPLLMMPTGTGKTVTSVITAAKIGYRLGVVVLAKYQEKWKNDIKEILDINDDRICVVDGGKDLKNVTFWKESGKPLPDVFIFTITTNNNFLKMEETDSKDPLLEQYGCSTQELFTYLGIGTIIIDESHEHPHAVYRTFAHMHVRGVISLSATFLTKDPMLREIQRMMFPKEMRFDKVKMRKYIHCHSCGYQIMNFSRSKVRASEYGSNNYSQVAFERTMMANKSLFSQYLEMIRKITDEAYIENYIAGDKLAIFVGTEKMAKSVCYYLKQSYPNLDIRTKLHADPYENAIDPDIRVTTIQSCGTAVDIPNLRVTIMTNSIDSPIANVQTLGRLRFLKDRDVHFYYLWCANIPKQREYHLKKREVFEGRYLTFSDHLLDNLNA